MGCEGGGESMVTRGDGSGEGDGSGSLEGGRGGGIFIEIGGEMSGFVCGFVCLAISNLNNSTLMFEKSTTKFLSAKALAATLTVRWLRHRLFTLAPDLILWRVAGSTMNPREEMLMFYIFFGETVLGQIIC